MNPARMPGRYSLNLATTLSATAKLVTLVSLVTLGACSDTQDSKSDSTKREDKVDASSRDAEAETDTKQSQKEPGAAQDVEDDAKSASTEDDAKSEGEGAGFCGVLNVMRSDCQVCHAAEPVAGAPMPLVTFADFMKPAVSDPSRKVYELVDQRVHDEARPMPPAGKMSAEKLAPLEAWLKAGVPEAKASCEEPTSVKRTEPDETWPEDCEDIYSIVAHDPDDASKPFTIPANSEIHPYIMVDAPWGDDDVQLLATRPITDNLKAVHHWILWEAKGRTNLTFWAPGATGDSFPDDVGLYMPKGKQSMGLDMHYFNLNNDKEVKDASGLEVCVVRKNRRPKTATLYGLFGNANVPPNERVVNSTSCTVKGEFHLLGVNPHMHHMGRHGHLDLQRGGTGPIEVLHDGPFSFEEQTMKPIKDTLIKEGDILTTVCTFENTTDRMIQFGESTNDEMCINWIRYYPKGSFSCSSMREEGDAPIDPNSTGNGDFPTGEDQDQDAGMEEPPAN